MYIWYFIDDLILTRIYEPLAQLFVDWFGVSHFYLAEMFALATIGLMITGNMKVAGVIYILFFMGDMLVVAKTKPSPGFLNPIPVLFRKERVVYLVFLNIDLTYLSFFGLNSERVLVLMVLICWTSYLYFLACTPNPPGQSKLSNIIEKASKMWVRAPAH